MLSGFGFELTFRLKKAEGEAGPPMWPTTLLNKLAAYVFHTGICTIVPKNYRNGIKKRKKTPPQKKRLALVADVFLSVCGLVC